MKVLLIGSGGREHALAWKMAQSPQCERMWAVPGNPGIAEHAECVAIGVDGRDFEDCLSNLLDNAIKYTPEGGAIRVVVTEDDENVSISITDTGMGIAEDSVDDIFDPFRRGNLALSADIPGTGLGLAIVREVVEQANGRVSVRSTVGKGSEFVVSFPKRRGPLFRQAVRNTKATTLDVDSASTTDRE